MSQEQIEEAGRYDEVRAADPAVAAALDGEIDRQRDTLAMIEIGRAHV